MNTAIETFGSFVSARRKQAGLSQSTLAARLRVSNTYLSDIENNRRHPASQQFLEDLSCELCVPRIELLRRHPVYAWVVRALLEWRSGEP